MYHSPVCSTRDSTCWGVDFLPVAEYLHAGHVKAREISKDIMLDLLDNENSYIEATVDKGAKQMLNAAEAVKEPTGAGVEEDLRGMDASKPEVIVLSLLDKEVTAKRLLLILSICPMRRKKNAKILKKTQKKRPLPTRHPCLLRGYITCPTLSINV